MLEMFLKDFCKLFAEHKNWFRFIGFPKITTRSSSHLAKHKVVRSEDPPHSAGLDAVHGAGLQVPEDGSRYLEVVIEHQKLSDSCDFPPKTV